MILIPLEEIHKKWIGNSFLEKTAVIHLLRIFFTVVLSQNWKLELEIGKGYDFLKDWIFMYR